MRAWWVVVAVALCATPRQALGSEPAPTWVFFGDKGVAGAQLGQALAERAATLAPRALKRRQRARTDGGVDERDVRVFPPYVSGVVATGAAIRARSRWLNAVSVVASDAQLASIAALPYVLSTRSVARRSREPTPRKLAPRSARSWRDASYGPADYGVAGEQLEVIEVPSLHDCGLSGEGVVVGVQDTGFSLAHEAFAHLDVLAQHDFINDDDETANEPGDPQGQHDHGTSVLSLLAGLDSGDFTGVAPDVTLILAKTEDTSQEQPIEEDWFVEGIEWIESLGADLMTASLGYHDWYAPEDLDGQTAVTSVAAGIAIENGLIVISAAGNWGPAASTLGAPADTDGLLAIGAVNINGNVADFSSRGPTADGRIKPDLCAVGVDNWVVSPDTSAGYEQGNGTSYAAPMAAGVVALLLQAFPGSSPEQMRELLTTTASHATTPDNDHGWGIIAGYAAAGLYCTCQDVDADGFYDVECGGQDCDDQDAALRPDAEEACNGFDDDCDEVLFPGEEDLDGDGWLSCDSDCDDEDADVHPSAEEICDDELDNDCDGQTDVDDIDCYVPPPPPPPAPQAPPNGSLEGSCGCRMAPSGSGGWGLLALVVLASARRARRQGRDPRHLAVGLHEQGCSSG